MNLPTNPADIEALLLRLYEEKRQLQANGVENPTFVFFVLKEHRYEVERRILHYLTTAYQAKALPVKINYGGESARASYFHFPLSDAAIVLMEFA